MNYTRLFNNRKVQFAALAVVLGLGLLLLRDGNPATLDVNYGIEFIGGVRIPVSLEEKVDPATMSLIVDTLKQRINKYGLSQSVVKPLGDQEVIVEIPKAKADVIASVQSILREQGHFEALIDGNVALQGEDILAQAVGGAQGEQVLTNSDGGISWELSFAASRSGGERFSKTALGKGNYPVYMFLDRPTKAAILVSRNKHLASVPFGAETALEAALKKNGDDLLLIFEEEFNQSETELARGNFTTIVLSSTLIERNPILYRQLNASYRLLVRSDEDLTPVIQTAGADPLPSRWRGIGLLSAPTLNPQLADGFVSQFYTITGGAQGTTPEQQRADAVREIKELKSVISGGRLPVATSLGSAYTVAASLGEQFLVYSGIGFVLASLAVSLLIVIRYRKLKLIAPIVITNMGEVVILTAVVGTIGTIDLAAMAGIITLIGQGVDDQILITDEVLRRRSSGENQPASKERDTKDRVARAFRIVLTVASVSVVTMLPLLLSGIVEITGFALAAILGVLIGVVITRPAFGVFIEEMFGS